MSPFHVTENHVREHCWPIRSSSVCRIWLLKKARRYILVYTSKDRGGLVLLERLVNALNRDKIPYAIVGGVAVALHGAPRGTVDIDIIIKHEAKFFTALESCLKNLGFQPRLPVTAKEIFQFKKEYISRRNLIAWSFYNAQNPIEVIDIILTHDLNEMRVVNKKIGLSKLSVISIEDLIRMKTESGRKQDREDVKVLREILK